MRQHFERAVDNIASLGDTDVFPFPIENHVFADCRDDVVDTLEEFHRDFEEMRMRYPRIRQDARSFVGYFGLRQVSQLDPLWNAYLLGLTISLADPIEEMRCTLPDDMVFAYRYDPDDSTNRLFATDGWHRFRTQSLLLARKYNYVVVTDIADCYPRLPHHRIDNQLHRIDSDTDTPWRIKTLLGDFSRGTSYGLPVGGEAARILCELLLHNADVLLSVAGIKFCRYADDYRIFCNSMGDAYTALIRLSEILDIEGLTLQKSKTRIMSTPTFIHSFPPEERAGDDGEPNVGASTGDADTDIGESQAFLKLSFRYDPYSPTASEDYERLKSDVNRFDILGLLSAELEKEQVDIALTRRLIRVIKFLPDEVRKRAVLTIVDKLEDLAPVYPSVMIALKNIFGELDDQTREKIAEIVHALIVSDSYLMKLDLNLSYSLRILAELDGGAEREALIARLYDTRRSAFLKADIILMMARWKNWPWLSEIRTRFEELRGPERRAFIVASYVLGDEGQHWRKRYAGTFSPLEVLVRKWAQTKAQVSGWIVPI